MKSGNSSWWATHTNLTPNVSFNFEVKLIYKPNFSSLQQNQQDSIPNSKAQQIFQEHSKHLFSTRYLGICLICWSFCVVFVVDVSQSPFTPPPTAPRLTVAYRVSGTPPQAPRTAASPKGSCVGHCGVSSCGIHFKCRLKSCLQAGYSVCAHDRHSNESSHRAEKICKIY